VRDGVPPREGSGIPLWLAVVVCGRLSNSGSISGGFEDGQSHRAMYAIKHRISSAGTILIPASGA